MNSARNPGWITINVFVVVLTGLSVWLTIANAGTSDDLLGSWTVQFLVLWAVYDLWLRLRGGHRTDKQWPDSLVSFGAALGVQVTTFSATHLVHDLLGVGYNTTGDGLFTMAGIAILATAIGVELYRIERAKAVTG